MSDLGSIRSQRHSQVNRVCYSLYVKKDQNYKAAQPILFSWVARLLGDQQFGKINRLQPYLAYTQWCMANRVL